MLTGRTKTIPNFLSSVHPLTRSSITLASTKSTAKAIFRPLATMVKPINLQLGWPSKSLFPSEAIHQASTAALLNTDIAGDALIYGPDPGYQPLRESLSKWLTGFYKPGAGTIPVDHILIGNGASMALSIILAKFTDPVYTKRVFMIEPTYFHACPMFEDEGFQGRLRGVPEDEEGLDVKFLRAAFEKAEKEEGLDRDDGSRTERAKDAKRYPKLYRHIVYAVPTFSNPSAKVMSLRRRKELVLLARQYDALVITDDVYDMLRWPVDPSVSVSKLPTPPPRLVDIDRELPNQSEYGNTASNGSFSKIVAPGVRVGWVEGTSAFIYNLSTHGSTKSGGAPGHMSSVFMDQMLRTRSLDKHISEVLIPTYRKRYAVLMEAVDKHLVPLGVEVTTGQEYVHDLGPGQSQISEAGGFFTYMSLPANVQPAEKVAAIALDRYGLKFAHGAMMVAAGDETSLERAKTSFGKGVRLSWSWHTEDEIREGIERLAQVVKDIQDGTVKQKDQNASSEGLDLR